MTEEQKAICHKIADHYGYEHQRIKAVEEMAELIQQISKTVVDRGDFNCFLLEEYADVFIMMEQMQYLLGKLSIHSEIDRYINMKLYRQLERMERENDA
jgi:hypothetical protein